MILLSVRNVEEALREALRRVLPVSPARATRNGPAYVAPEPVLTEYARPDEMVLFAPDRDANPFFHLVEALWMLAGRDDVAALTPYVKRMAEYSDDGISMPGAYGRRWRKHFGLDQVGMLILGLKKNPDCRRSGVLQMWDADVDPGRVAMGGADVPCNLAAHFQINVEGQLELSVFNRSNDAIWGAYGANAVHFAMLQRYVATALRAPMGPYRQYSCNLHFYAGDLLERLRAAAAAPLWRATVSRYEAQPYLRVAPFACAGGLLYNDRGRFDAECAHLFSEEGFVPDQITEPFLRQVAVPMIAAHAAHRAGRTEQAIDILMANGADCDWRQAGIEWLRRRNTPITKEDR